MTMQDGNNFVRLGKATLKAFDRLGRERNLRDEDVCGLAALEGSPNRLQVDFGFAAAGDTVQQNWFGCFGRSERVSDFVQRENLFPVQLKIGRGNKLLVRVRVALDGFFSQLNQTALGECAQGLVIER